MHHFLSCLAYITVVVGAVGSAIIGAVGLLAAVFAICTRDEEDLKAAAKAVAVGLVLFIPLEALLCARVVVAP